MHIKIKRLSQNKLFVFVVCTMFIVSAALYYYWLQCEYPPDSECIMSISRMYFHLTQGSAYWKSEIIHDIGVFCATKIGGLSYFSVRLLFVFCYVILLLCTMILCIKSKTSKGVNLYILPLVALFSVILFSTVDDPTLVQDPGGKDFIYVWPFHYHYAARIYALVCLIVLFKIFRCNDKIKKCIWSGALIIICIYAGKSTDLIFYVTFLLPTVIVVLLHAIQRKSKKYIMYVFTAGMVGLLLSKILGGRFDQLWGKETVSVYGHIYGGGNWISPEMFGEHLLSYMKLLCLNFNIPIMDRPVISLYSFVFLGKFVLIIIGYIIILHILKCCIYGTYNRFQYDIVDQILAWAYFILTLVYLFTDLGTVRNCRYFPTFTTMMTILLCRNLGILPRILGVDMLKNISDGKKMFFLYTFILCICSMDKVWECSAPNNFETDLKAIISYVENTQYGYVLAPYWFYPQVSAMSNGNVIAMENESQIKEVYGDKAKAAYIITWNCDNTDGDYWSEVFISNYKHCSNYEEICEYYSEPTHIINYDKLQLIVFEDGIEAEE